MTNKVKRFRGMPWRVYAGRRIAHYLLGHMPIYLYQVTPESRERKYKCYWCDDELRSGMWQFLYDQDGKANQ